LHRAGTVWLLALALAALGLAACASMSARHRSGAADRSGRRYD